MINNLKIKILAIYNSKHKFFNTLVVSGLILLLFILITQKDKNAAQPVVNVSTTQSSLPTNVRRDENQGIPFTFNEKESYYINQIITNNDGVTGFSWDGDKNIYSTKNGIYEAGTNNPIITVVINEIRWANNFSAVVKTENRWKMLDYNTKQLVEIPVILYNPVIDDKRETIIDFKRNNLFMYNISDYSVKDLKFEEPIQKVFFVKNNKELVVLTNYATKA